ncbi:TonB-dependent receptor [Flavobacterium sp. F372]|uniref:TonB-dependent receptor n=1 Tax=Flavobacterium bernardetii TaxID=2813823 RepID=A0ABR7J0T4_9FLAO|nr:TonB-dependent receptor [Flavobacterium bernardetii]MBC5835512.1 TonB-dependent receptor [Flavobacterium bernardetii]NHF70876.1 TonB-dependent receptor [Flavobacterium bernardetii]
MKKIILLLAIFISGSISAQSVKVTGILKDSDNLVIETANVMAVNQVTKAMDAYNITSEKGEFSLNLKANTEYIIKAGYIGYAPFERKITTTKENMTFDIVLTGTNTIETVEIVKEMPVRISGDTIIYNSDSFTNGTEKKLEDVLKKLPGVSVNKDGEIEVEGKKVQKVMVEGKDFFDGDTKIATKNIPADALDKIQVLRNYNEVSNLKGLENNEDNVAINIKLKEGKKNFWFGDMLAGAGVGDTEGRSILNPKLFYYSPKYSVNLIGNLNNIGELPLTMQDYFKFTGGFKNMMKKGGSNFGVSSNDLGIMGMRNNRAKNIDAKFGAANFSYNPSKAWTISGFGIYSYNKTDLQTDNIYNRSDKLPNGTPINVTENRQDNSKQKTKLGLFKLSSSYVPSAKMHLDYDALLKTSDQLESQNVISNLQGNIFTEKSQKPISVSQNLNYYYTLNDKNVFAFEVQNLFQQEDPFYNANLQTQPFVLVGYTPFQTRNDVNQNRFVKTNKTDAKFDYYYMVTPKSNINVTIGNTYSYQNFNSSMFQILDNGTQNNLTDSSNTNDVDYAFNDAFVGLHYKMLFGKFTLNPGVSLHQFNTNDTQLNSSNKMSFNRVLPDFYALWQMKKSQSLTYNFSLTNNFTDIVKLSQGYVFSNYNSLYSGNRFLENSVSQVHSLRFFKFSMFNMENIFANLIYTKQTDIITNKAFIEPLNVNQISSSVNMNSNFPNESLSGMFNYGRSFARYFKANAGASVAWSKNNNIRVNLDKSEYIQNTESFTQNYDIGFSTNLKNLPNIELAYDFTINDFQDQVNYVDNPSVTLEYFFLDAFSFTSEYSFYHNRNKAKTIDTEYDFLTASLSYQKKDSKLEYKLSATNLLNTTSLNDNTFNALGGSTNFSSYYVQPRYVIFSLKYNL